MILAHKPHNGNISLFSRIYISGIDLRTCESANLRRIIRSTNTKQTKHFPSTSTGATMVMAIAGDDVISFMSKSESKSERKSQLKLHCACNVQSFICGPLCSSSSRGSIPEGQTYQGCQGVSEMPDTLIWEEYLQFVLPIFQRTVLLMPTAASSSSSLH